MKKTLTILMILTTAAAAESPAAPEIKIYLPRSLEVSAATLTLGQICIVRCDDEKLLAKVAEVSVGRGPLRRESLSLARSTLLACISACGIDIRAVTFTGAPAVTLESKDQEVAPDELVRAVQDFLVQKNPLPGDRVWQAITVPAAVVLADTADVKYVVRPAAGKNSPDQIRVEVAVLQKDKEVAATQIVFRAGYVVRQAVAARDIPAHSHLEEADFTVGVVATPSRPAQDWISPVGMETTAAIAQGKVIHLNQLKMPKLEIVVHRDQKVKMLIDGLGFRISGMGQALDNGRPGDVIRVMNVDSRQAVACRVAMDGTVHPLYDEETNK